MKRAHSEVPKSPSPAFDQPMPAAPEKQENTSRQAKSHGHDASQQVWKFRRSSQSPPPRIAQLPSPTRILNQQEQDLAKLKSEINKIKFDLMINNDAIKVISTQLSIGILHDPGLHEEYLERLAKLQQKQLSLNEKLENIQEG
jgi:hypothetical protein